MNVSQLRVQAKESVELEKKLLKEGQESAIKNLKEILNREKEEEETKLR